MNPLLDAGPEVGPGQPGSSPDFEPVGISDGLPAALIDRAVDTALTAMWGDGYEGVEDDVREALWAAAPLLVAHGREQEREKWESRIEAEIASRERIIEAMDVQFSREHAAGRFSSAQSKLRSADRERGRVRLLRSLLTGEGENGE